MKAFIEIEPHLEEKKIPIIKLSKSKRGETSSATFLFIKPNIFKVTGTCNFFLKPIRLIYENKEILSQRTQIIFREGEPFLLKAFFIFTTREQQIDFLNFIFIYARKNKLIYSKLFENKI